MALLRLSETVPDISMVCALLIVIKQKTKKLSKIKECKKDCLVVFIYIFFKFFKAQNYILFLITALNLKIFLLNTDYVKDN